MPIISPNIFVRKLLKLFGVHKSNYPKNFFLYPLVLPKNIPTPCFYVDEKVFNRKLATFPKNIIIAYSLKTNYHLGKFALKNNTAIEVVSENEFNQAVRLGFRGSKIYVNGPYKTKSLYIKAMSSGSHLHMDSEEQIKDFLSLSRSYRFGLRFNPQVNDSRFGLVKNELIFCIHKFKMYNQVNSLHVHLGSNIGDVSIYNKAKDKVNELIILLKKVKVKLEYIDFGGGFPIQSQHTPNSSKSWHPEKIDEYLKVINKINHDYLVLEPGRYLSQESVSFFTKVISLKIQNNFQTATLDSTVNMLPLVNYQASIITLARTSNIRESRGLPTLLYGCSCQEMDKMSHEIINLPPLRVGDILCFRNVGAYNQSMKNNFIFKGPITVFSKSAHG